ncbi:unnamed protein product [Litomosoides sigmodontis]|uniref:Uncharacterized protein n=1 Tax=Litomosoides sigmodontis TaxID=42156 RepID=A0A3P6UQK0_LITSI|nr:unnamed protein product [Litomosoides sigmodontis]
MKRKKREKHVENKSEWLLRKRQGFRLLTPVGYQSPTCAHGPCLLFERRTGQTTEKFFACAVYRSQKRCPFRMNINCSTVSSNSSNNFDNTANPTTSTTSFCYAAIRKKVNLLRAKNENIYYCTTCNDVVSQPHAHPIKGPLEISSLRRPSQLLFAHVQNHSESQYWFTEESLLVIVNAIEKSGCDGLLCIGTPTVFEHFQSQNLLRQKIKSFLLDVDARFVPFLRSSHFAVYSMLTNHFYDPVSIEKLVTFFGSVHGLVIICDPPFGVFIEALMNSIRKLQEQFFKFNSGKSKNHSKYKRPEKSIVRIFTDFPLNEFDLSDLPGYRPILASTAVSVTDVLKALTNIVHYAIVVIFHKDVLKINAEILEVLESS